jgi:hypothetical protein
MVIVGWKYPESLPTRVWTCGHCGAETGSKEGYGAQTTGHAIYICPVCERPTYFDGATKQQIPGARIGADVNNLPPDVATIYDEARVCMAAHTYTAAVLLCRTLLMRIAVAEGAPTRANFTDYIDYLNDNGYVAPRAAIWLDLVRSTGNIAAHQLRPMTEVDATRLVSFLAILLSSIYALPRPSPDPPQV